MVDVAGKGVTQRVARAAGRIRMRPATLRRIAAGDARKGDVLGVARIAGDPGREAHRRPDPALPPARAHATSPSTSRSTRKARRGRCEATVATTGRTGVEMEALTAVAAGLLTIYDMCKAADRGMRLESIRLLEKKGGKSGHWIARTR